MVSQQKIMIRNILSLKIDLVLLACYWQNICAPWNHVLKPNSSCGDIWKWGLWQSPHELGMVSFKRRSQRALSSLLATSGYSKKTVVCEPGNGLKRHGIYQNLDLGLSSFQNSVISYPLYSFLLQQPEQMKTLAYAYVLTPCPPIMHSNPDFSWGHMHLRSSWLTSPPPP